MMLVNVRLYTIRWASVLNNLCLPFQLLYPQRSKPQNRQCTVYGGVYLTEMVRVICFLIDLCICSTTVRLETYILSHLLHSSKSIFRYGLESLDKFGKLSKGSHLTLHQFHKKKIELVIYRCLINQGSLVALNTHSIHYEVCIKFLCTGILNFYMTIIRYK